MRIFIGKPRGKDIRNTVLSSLASVRRFAALFVAFSHFFFLYYTHKKVMRFSRDFERNKNMIVKLLLMKRGRYNRSFLHVTAMLVLGIGILLAPLLAETYPVFSGSNQNVLSASIASAQEQDQSITVDSNVFQTKESVKPRSEVVTYAVQRGDTISTIAKKFGISEDTIRWTNDLANDDLAIGDELKILPVTGMLHKVTKGDTVQTIAKKYDTEAQKIADFPFNDFVNPETFSLVEGQLLVVPDGIKPEVQQTFKRQVYLVQGPVSITSAGFTWPLRGAVSQFASWYHMGLDITSPVGTPIVAAQSGKVTLASSGTWDGGYGTHVVIDNGGGMSSNYAHLSGLNVSAGDDVVAGKTVVGWVGLTGRTTGAHVHFEIMRNGALVDPLPYLQ